ncbi:hypothetical protein DCAR_0414613 [Daucus carota subsp. sativus]|uniref:Uncharacterized protein n=1 Tax=Daucus carota subsp. sativus TaxID=79200 RepID=A0A175YBX1_DAUCS|nr:hypothetical protein DCAR_0414613 [Daucus carota subsp. sativus]
MEPQAEERGRRERNCRWKVGDGGWVGDVLARESEMRAPIRGDVGETAAELVAATLQQPWRRGRKREREKAVGGGRRVVGDVAGEEMNKQNGSRMKTRREKKDRDYGETKGLD